MSPHPAYRQIWDTVRKIPEGRVAAYGQVADLAGLPGRARLVGRALGAAPAAPPVPWHRVLRASGQIAFPADSPAGRRQREALLAEGVVVRGQRVDLRQFGWTPDLAAMLFELEY